ncbi:TlpA family protein disulfide reductase [Mucilaginibacter terrae]|uniref:TlpA family protein disulfide reductase n=1 Tax=Mucilaginibacter terrae TaxID=1955052 RepID=UPI003632CCA9
MNRILTLIVVALIACGCNKLPHITFNGKAPGLTNAVFLVTDAAGNSIMGDNITAGTFKKDTVLENTGYGSISINRNGAEDTNEFEVYLEAGEYTIEVDTAHLERYPKITSASQIQKELSAYHTLQDDVSFRAELLVKQLQDQIKNFKAYLGGNIAYANLQTRLTMATAKVGQVKLQAFKEFTDQYPNSIIAARAMEELDYTSNPAAYSAIYKKLSAAAKNTDEGKRVGEKLSKLMKVLPGANAPTITGTTPDGHTFDPSKLDKKVYVVDFWKAGNQVSRINHQDMLKGIINNVNTKNVGFISVSLDNKRDWWTKAIADDHLTWPQYSDLKGNESANATNWVITTIPTFYLVDTQWRIIQRDVQFPNLERTINEYLKKQASNSKNFSL